MKRFYKFLMPLVAIVALAMPVSVTAQVTCPIRIVGADAYGDGWNGGSLAIMQGGTTVGTFSLSDGSTGTAYFTVSSDTSVVFVWSAGSYDDEVSIQIYNGADSLVFSVTEPTVGTIYTMTSVNCPACPGITGVYLDSVSNDYARIAWNGTGSFGYEWDEAATFVPGTGYASTTTDSYVELTSLTTGTSYTILLWRECGSDGNSDSVTYTFHTTAGMATLPYNSGFEVTDDQGWEIVNNSTNKWYIDTAVNNGGSYSLYISNDNGVTNAYNIGGTQFSYAYRTFLVTDSGQYGISFDWRGYGESSYDYLRAWIAPATATFTAGQLPDGSTSAYNYTTTTPAGWIDLGGKMNYQNNWQTSQTLPYLAPGTYNLVFMWANDGSGGSQPPAAVDNVSIRLLNCYQPQNFAVSYLTPDTISMTWTPGGSETTWEITNGIDTVEVTDTTFTFDSLAANTTYTIRVRSICDGGDTSLWLSMPVRTPCSFIDSLPYTTSFESVPSGEYTSFNFSDPCWTLTTDATTYPYVYVSSSTTYAHTGNKGIYWYRSSTSDAMYGNYQCLVLPGVAVSEEHPMSAVQLKFWAKYSSGTGVPTFHVGVMSNPNDISTFVETGTFVPTSEWTEYVFPFGNYTGTGNFAAVRANYQGTYWYVYLDDFTLEYAPTCPPIVDLNVEGTSTSGAYITWGTQDGLPGIPDQYEIDYIDLDDTTATAVTTTTTVPYIFLSGLTPTTNYKFRVRVDCGSDDYTPWDSIDFTTAGFGCLMIDTTAGFSDTIGNGTSTSTYLPSYSFYNYGLTQQIFTATEIGHGGQIQSFAFKMSAVSQQRTYEIYMGHTPQATATDFIHPSDLTLVYNGGANTLTANQWTTFNLTTPFNYNGTDNLVIILRDLTGSYVSGNSGYVHSAPAGAGRYVYQDGGAYDPFSYSGGYSLSVRNNIILSGASCAVEATCAAPVVGVIDIDTASASVAWAPGANETSWNAYYRVYGDTAWITAATGLSTTTYTFSNLSPATTYEFSIATVCSEGEFNTVVSGTTGCAPAHLPLTEDFELLSGNFSRACWTAGSTFLGSSYPYPIVVNLSGDPNKLCLFYNGAYMIFPQVAAPLNQLQIRFTFVQGGDSVRFLMGLMPNMEMPIDSMIVLDTLIRSNIDTSTATVNVTYQFAALDPQYNNYHIAFWDAFNDNYSFLDNIVVEYIPQCGVVSNLSASNVTTTTADISWAAGGENGTAFIVEYGPRGFAPGTGTVVTATASPVTLTGLNHSTSYDAYVYTACTALNDTSIASQVVQFATQCDAFATLPYSVNFENILPPGSGSSVVMMPNCWATEVVAGTTPPRVYYTSNTSMAPSPSYCLYFYNIGVAALPQMAMPLDTLMVSFHAYNSSPNAYGLVIGAVDSIGAGYAASFQPIDTIVFEYGNNGEYQINSFLNGYTGTANRLAIKNFNVDSSSTYASVYIDDLTVNYLPSCIAPQRVHATALSNTSADLAWTISTAPSYSVEYGPHGFVPGTGTTVTTTTNDVSLTGLTPNTQYDARIVGLCSATETSDTTVYTFTTMRAAPVTALPYFCDFSDSAMAAAWEPVNGSQNNKWVLGSAAFFGTGDSMAYYVSADSGATNTYSGTTSHTYVYRSFTLPVGNYNFSFKWHGDGEGGGSSTYAYDYMRAYLVPAGMNIVEGVAPDGGTSSYNNAYGAPQAGWIALGGNVPLADAITWESLSDDVNITTAGTYNLVFYWGNDASVFNDPAGAFDNVEVSRNVCPIVDLQVDSAFGTSIYLSWTASSDSYEVEYGNAGFSHGSGIVATTTNTHIVLNGLTSLTNYDFYVRGICNAGLDTSRWYYVGGTTGLCDNATYAYNWDSTMSTTTSSYSPIGYATYNYSYVQTIIDSAMLATLGGDITAFAFYPTSTTSSDYYTHMDVYMANVSESTVPSGFIHPDSTDHVFVQVLSDGNLNFTTTGEHIVALDAPFTWDGHSNLLVAVNRGHGSWSSSTSFAAHNQTSGKARYVYQDSAPYDINTVSGGTSISAIGDIKLISCGASCAAPVVNVTNVDYQGADITAIGSGLAYELVYGTDIAALGDTMTSTTGTFTLTGLTPDQQYFVGVRQQCDSAWSAFTIVNFTTDELPCFTPDSLEVVATSFSTATLHWISAGSATQWAIEVNGAGVQRFDTVGTNPYTIPNLYADQDYTASVRAICLTGVVESDWSDTIAFHTDACLPVSGVTVNNVTASSATASWQPTNGALGYRVSYGEYDFIEAQALRVEVDANTTSYTFTGLEAETRYEFYVQTKCGEGLFSSITQGDRIDFMTEASQGIYDVESGTLTLFPNPASTSVTLSVSGIDGEVTVEIVDMNGRKVSEHRTQNSELTIDVTSMAQGAYFVRVTGERQTAVRKLIVR